MAASCLPPPEPSPAGSFINVRITGVSDGELTGEIEGINFCRKEELTIFHEHCQ